MKKRKVRVLIVDDEVHIRSLIRLIVTSLGAEVVAEAGDGEQALELYKAFSPDMVMLDINMPKMDGVSVLKEIMVLNPKTLVVMLTSLNTVDVVKECLDLGARNYILKNVPAEELNKMISETWGQYMADIRAAKS
jgi:Response regulator containing CheY-like receiver domain and AraC-type DNA-binding domain